MTEGIVFFKDYFDYMDDLSPEQFVELMKLIRDLRFSDKDTQVDDVEDRSVRLAWRALRPSVLKSARNAKDYHNRKNKKDEEGIDKVKEFSNTFTVEEKQKLGEKAVKRMQTNDASLKDEIVKTVNEHLEMCGHPGDEELFKEIMKKLDEHALKNKPKSHITPWGTEVPY